MSLDLITKLSIEAKHTIDASVELAEVSKRFQRSVTEFGNINISALVGTEESKLKDLEKCIQADTKEVLRLSKTINESKENARAILDELVKSINSICDQQGLVLVINSKDQQSINKVCNEVTMDTAISQCGNFFKPI